MSEILKKIEQYKNILTTSKSEELQKMLKGEDYDWRKDRDLNTVFELAQDLIYDYNMLRISEKVLREQIMKGLLGRSGTFNMLPRPKITVAYGCNIYIGDCVGISFDVTMWDCAPVRIGTGAMIGHGVSMLTGGHPIEPERRWKDNIVLRPIIIEEDVWICAKAIILGGVTIGKGSVVAAGAVVTKNVPPMTVVAGNPAKFVKLIESSVEYESNAFERSWHEII